MHIDGDYNFLFTLLTTKKKSGQITIPYIKSKLPRISINFLHHSYPLILYQCLHLTQANLSCVYLFVRAAIAVLAVVVAFDAND